MIHVFITVKPSSRYPGKNARLAGYTVAWLAMELLHMEESVRVYTVGVRSELPNALPPGWRHVECRTGSHYGDLLVAENVASPAAGDVCMLVQLTQPLRRMGLLGDIAQATRLHGSAVTACAGRQDDWRTMQANGTWNPCKGGRVLLHDGALYGWRAGNVASIFDASAPHGVVVNYDGQPVDIDTPADVPQDLPGAFVKVLLCDFGLTMPPN